jgi:hypothetical protein
VPASFSFFYLLLSGGVEYILKPKVVGKRVQMHTLVVFLSIIGGLNHFRYSRDYIWPVDCHRISHVDQYLPHQLPKDD